MLELLIREIKRIRGVTDVTLARTFNIDTSKVISLNFKKNIHGIVIKEGFNNGYTEYEVHFYKGFKRIKVITLIQKSHEVKSGIDIIIITLKTVLHGL